MVSKTFLNFKKIYSRFNKDSFFVSGSSIPPMKQNPLEQVADCFVVLEAQKERQTVFSGQA